VDFKFREISCGEIAQQCEIVTKTSTMGQEELARLGSNSGTIGSSEVATSGRL
jgi:hypothetical protein